MTKTLRWLAALALLAPPAGTVGAQAVQITPLAGYQFGGSVESDRFDAELLKFSFDEAAHYAGALDIRVREGWNFEVFYSRSKTELRANRLAAPSFGLTIERLMAGIQEEKGQGKVKYFGTFLMGGTRMKPELADFDAKTRFTLGLTLGLKPWFSKNLGLRLQGDAFWTKIGASDNGLYCANGVCLFEFNGSGFLQAALSGGIILAF